MTWQLLSDLKTCDHSEHSTVRKHLRLGDRVPFSFTRTAAGLYVIDKIDFPILKTPSLSTFAKALQTHFSQYTLRERIAMKEFEAQSATGDATSRLSDAFESRQGVCIEHAIMTKLWAQQHAQPAYLIIGDTQGEAHAFNIFDFNNTAFLVDTCIDAEPGQFLCREVVGYDSSALTLEHDTVPTYSLFRGYSQP